MELAGNDVRIEVDRPKVETKFIATLAVPALEVRVLPDKRIEPEYFPALTGLRFFLALWVVFHHLVSKGMMLNAWTVSLPPAAGMFLEQGHVAVRTFFALSGFVLAQTYATSRWTRKDLFLYCVARFARVYPVYLVSLLVVSYFILQFLETPGHSVIEKLTAMGVCGFLLQGWMPNPGAGWNTPAWSLSCEFLFYLLLPALLVSLGQRSKWRLALLTVAALFLPIALRRAGIPLAWKPVLHIGDFLVGIAAARIYALMIISGSRWLRRGHWLYVPAIAIGVTLVVFPQLLADITDLGTALRPLNGLLILGLALGGGACAKFLASAVPQYLGQASYSMYILHVPILWWFGNRGPRILGGMGESAAVIYVACIVAASAVCFEVVEKPANRIIRSWAKGKFEPIKKRPVIYTGRLY